MEAEYYERPRGCKDMVELESRCEDILDSWVSERRTMDGRTMELTRTERARKRCKVAASRQYDEGPQVLMESTVTSIVRCLVSRGCAYTL